MIINKCLHLCSFENLIRKIYEDIFGVFFPKPKISILIPFSTKDKQRKKTFKWILQYWKHQLPCAEIIIGKSKSKIFCKTEALNDAFRRSSGKIIVILDADAYIEGRVIEKAADKILDNLDSHLWYVPYRKLYRLNKEISEKLLQSDPKNPMKLPCPLSQEYLDNDGTKSGYGHHYGAMLMVMPREAVETLGCFDPRFKGWGGEDVSLLRALDTLWGKHKTMKECIYHIWHPFLGNDYKSRRWNGQDNGSANERLGNRYNDASRKPSKMRVLVDAGCEHCYDYCIYEAIWELICYFSDQNLEKIFGRLKNSCYLCRDN